VQPADTFYHVNAGAQHKVISIREYDFRTNLPQLSGRDTLDCPSRANGHKRRRRNLPVRRLQNASPGCAIFVPALYLKAIHLEHLTKRI
jgi:hypothetical protein